MEYKIKSKIWVELDGNMLLGEGRVRLLNAIDQTGSLNKAAASLKMSYKKAWGLIDSINKSSKFPIVIKSIGGKDGGGTILTSHGKEMILAFEKINGRCQEFLNKELKEISL